MKTNYVKNMIAKKTPQGLKVTVVRRVKRGDGWKNVTRRYLRVSETSGNRVFWNMLDKS